MRRRVYLAGPYSTGDVAVNVRNAMAAWHLLWDLGFDPYCPHLTHFLHLHRPLRYESWLEYDSGWLEVCEAVLRLPGKSNGADRECGKATDLNIPVFDSIAELTAWRDRP